MPVELGFYTPCNLLDTPGREHHRVYHENVALARFADAELGVATLDIPEHHFRATLAVPGSLIMATHLAVQTQSAKVRTTVCPLPMHSIVRLAGEAALTDNLTGGRLELGVSRGGNAYVLRRFGQGFDRHREQFAEGVHVLSRLLNETDVVAEGEFYPVSEPTTIMPRPFEERRIPLWLGSTSQDGIEWAAKNGFNVITTAQQEPLELQRKQVEWFRDALEDPDAPDRPRIQVLTRVFVSESPEEVLRGLGNVVDKWRSAAARRPGVDVSLEVEVEDVEDTVIFGAPEEVLEGFEMRAELGFDGIVIDPLYHDPDFETAMRSLELLRDKVLPFWNAFAPASAGR